MKRFLKWLLIIIVSLVALFFVTVVGALYLIDPNQFKDDIARAVKTQTGRDLTIQGDIRVSVFPWLGFEIGETRLSNAAGFGQEPMVRIAHAEARVRLLSLFSAQPEIATLVLRGLNLRLARDAQGRSNWADLMPAADDKTPSRQTGDSGTGATPPPVGIPTVAGIRIEDAELLWRDGLNDQQLRVQKLNLRTGAIALRQSIRVDVSFELDSRAPAIDGDVVIQAQAWADPDEQLYRLNAVQIRPRLRGDVLPGGQLNGRLAMRELLASVARESINIDGLEVQTDQLSLNGTVGMRDFSAPRLDFKLRSEAINLDRLLAASTASDPAAPAAPSAAAGAMLLPLEAIRPLKLDGEIRIDRFVMSNLTLSEVQLNLTAADGVLTLLPQAALYGGRYRGNIRVDARQDVGKIAMQEDLSEVQIEPLLKDFMQKDYLSGRTNLKFRARAQGNTLDSMMASLNGVADIKLTGTQLKSKHLLYDMVQTLIRKQKLGKPDDFDKQVTVFDQVTAQFNITDGVARNDDLLGLSERVHIQGKGYLNLVTKQVDYTAYVIPKKSLRIPWVGGTAFDLKDQPIPYHVHGSLDALKFDPDFEEVIKRLAKQRANAIKDEKEAELKRKLEAEKRALKEKEAQEKQKLQQKIEKEKQQIEQELKNKLLDKLR